MICTDAHIIGPWVSERTGGAWTAGRGTAIGKVGNGVIQAGALYEDWNGANITCHIAGDGNWATKRFLWMLFDYPFNQIGAKRITAPINSTNVKSINLVTRMGFKLECTLTQATPDGDMFLFRMFRDECKYIRGKYGQK